MAPHDDFSEFESKGEGGGDSRRRGRGCFAIGCLALLIGVPLGGMGLTWVVRAQLNKLVTEYTEEAPVELAREELDEPGRAELERKLEALRTRLNPGERERERERERGEGAAIAEAGSEAEAEAKGLAEVGAGEGNSSGEGGAAAVAVAAAGAGTGAGEDAGDGESGGDSVELVLSDREINSLIQTLPDLEGLRDRLVVGIEGETLRCKVSVPLEDLPFNLGKGRFLNGEGVLRVSIRDGELDLRVDELTVRGKPLPAGLMEGLRGRNLAENVKIEDGDVRRGLRRIERLEVKDGMLRMRLRAGGDLEEPTEGAGEDEGKAGGEGDAGGDAGVGAPGAGAEGSGSGAGSGSEGEGN